MVSPVEKTDTFEMWRQKFNQVVELLNNVVKTFNGRVGDVVPSAGDYTAAMIGLENVDNTSDAEKPISIATQTALNEKANVEDMNTALDAKADSTTVTALETRIAALEALLSV